MAETAFTASAKTVERFNPAGPLGVDQRLACPNPECGDTDNLELIETVDISTPVSLYNVGVTFPEIERASDTETVLTHFPQRTIKGLRCGKCNWSYTGPNPLSRAVPVA